MEIISLNKSCFKSDNFSFFFYVKNGKDFPGNPIDELMIVSAKGLARDEFNFNAALDHWKEKECRKIFLK